MALHEAQPEHREVWQQLNCKVWNNSRAHNNVYFALRSNGGDTNHWAWTSDDNIKGGVPYYGSIGRIYTIPISHRPYVKVHATFDVPGRDPSCTAYGQTAGSHRTRDRPAHRSAAGPSPRRTDHETASVGAAFLAAIGALVAWATPRPRAGCQRGRLARQRFRKPLIVDSDEHGALVLDVASGEAIGFDAHGSVRWRDRDLAGRLYVDAAAPDAPVRAPPTAHRHRWVGGPAPAGSVGGPVTGTVLWARSPQDSSGPRRGRAQPHRPPRGPRNQHSPGGRTRTLTCSPLPTPPTRCWSSPRAAPPRTAC